MIKGNTPPLILVISIVLTTCVLLIPSVYRAGQKATATQKTVAIAQEKSEPMTAGSRAYIFGNCDNGYLVYDINGYSITDIDAIREFLRKQNLMPEA